MNHHHHVTVVVRTIVKRQPLTTTTTTTTSLSPRGTTSRESARRPPAPLQTPKQNIIYHPPSALPDPIPPFLALQMDSYLTPGLGACAILSISVGFKVATTLVFRTRTTNVATSPGEVKKILESQFFRRWNDTQLNCTECACDCIDASRSTLSPTTHLLTFSERNRRLALCAVPPLPLAQGRLRSLGGWSRGLWAALVRRVPGPDRAPARGRPPVFPSDVCSRRGHALRRASVADRGRLWLAVR